MKTGPSWVLQIISLSSFFHLICQVSCCCSSLSRFSATLHSFKVVISFSFVTLPWAHIPSSLHSFDSLFFSSVMIQRLLPVLSAGLQLFPFLFQNLTLLLIRLHQHILETHSVSAQLHMYSCLVELVLQGKMSSCMAYTILFCGIDKYVSALKKSAVQAFQINKILSVSK